jgi:GNAT superfamily N-acetyltransferase
MSALSGLELARRLEAAHAWRGVEYARAQQALHPDWPVAVKAVAGGFAVYVAPNSPVNWVTGLGMSGPVNAVDWAGVEDFYLERGDAPRLHLCPLADRSLLDLLRKHACRLESLLSVLACTLPDGVVHLPRPTGIEVTRPGPTEADLWIRTTAQGFGDTETPPQESVDILAPNFYAANAVPFLAWVDGQPAGGGSLLLHEGVAEFGGDSTRPAFRRRGVQMALLQARMTAARELGCDLAMLLTDPGSDSQHNAERAGFRVAYSSAQLLC